MVDTPDTGVGSGHRAVAPACRFKSCPSDQLDAITTERNAAVAEAKLWRDRYYETLQELSVCQSNYAACDQSHEVWEAAHAELLQMLRRTEVKLDKEIWARQGADDMLRHYRAILGMVARGEWPIAEIDHELYSELSTEGGARTP